MSTIGDRPVTSTVRVRAPSGRDGAATAVPAGPSDLANDAGLVDVPVTRDHRRTCDSASRSRPRTGTPVALPSSVRTMPPVRTAPYVRAPGAAAADRKSVV